MNDETIDLIATDPPFNKKRNRAATAGQYEDAWRWADDPSFQAERPDQWLWQPVHRIWLDQIRDENETLFGVIENTRLAQDDDTAAFLCFLGVRLLEMHRVLKPTGSIYLHCDHEANGYIRMVMDAIFGARNFRSEVIWRRHSAHNDAQRKWGAVHDTIFFYSKTNNYVWTGDVREPYDKEYLERSYRYHDSQGRFMTAPLKGRGVSGALYEYEWHGVISDAWRFPKTSLDELESQGLIYWPPKGKIPRRKVYLDESKGVPARDLILDITLTNSKERTGSPDQKPVALYERIIAASSNPGDIVLDPFAGCATTPIAAHNLGRRWVGIDRREDAAYHVANRLLGLGINVDDFKAQQQALMPQLQSACEIRYSAPVRTDDGETAPHLGPVYRRRKPATMRRAEMLDILAEQWGIRCWGCGFEPPSVEFLDLDHILPESEGGGNELENRAPLCGPCNKRKSNTMTLTALRRDNRRNERWYGHPSIDQRVDIRTAREWATDYLANLARERAMVGTV